MASCHHPQETTPVTADEDARQEHLQSMHTRLTAQLTIDSSAAPACSTGLYHLAPAKLC